MYSLAIDTTNSFFSICLFCNDQVIDYIFDDEKNAQSKNMFSHINNIFINKSIDYKDIEKIVTTIGPGSFNGVRVSLAACSGINFANKIPILGLSNLQIQAYFAKQQYNLTKSFYVVIDARRDQFYIQQFSSNLCELGHAQLVDIDFINKIDSKMFGAVILNSKISTKAFYELDSLTLINAKHIVQSFTFFSKNKLTKIPLPLYIREPDAIPYKIV